MGNAAATPLGQCCSNKHHSAHDPARLNPSCSPPPLLPPPPPPHTVPHYRTAQATSTIDLKSKTDEAAIPSLTGQTVNTVRLAASLGSFSGLELIANQNVKGGISGTINQQVGAGVAGWARGWVGPWVPGRQGHVLRGPAWLAENRLVVLRGMYKG